MTTRPEKERIFSIKNGNEITPLSFRTLVAAVFLSRAINYKANFSGVDRSTPRQGFLIRFSRSIINYWKGALGGFPKFISKLPVKHYLLVIYRILSIAIYWQCNTICCVLLLSQTYYFNSVVGKGTDNTIAIYCNTLGLLLYGYTTARDWNGY